LQIPRKYFW